TPAQEIELANIREESAKVRDELAAYDAIAQAKQPDWERHIAGWSQTQVLDPVSFLSAGGATLTEREDHALLASGINPQQDTLTVVVNPPLTGIPGFRLDVLTVNSLPKSGPGRANNGSFTLSEFRIQAAPSGEPDKAVAVPLTRAVFIPIGKETDPKLAF